MTNQFSTYFTSYNSGIQFRYITDLIATPDSGFLYVVFYSNPGLLIRESTLFKIGRNSWSFVFPTDFPGEYVSSVSLTSDGNYACQGSDTIYVITPSGQRVPNPSNSAIYLINQYSDGNQLVKEQNILRFQDSVSNVLESVPATGKYLANDSLLFAVRSDSLSRLSLLDGSTLWTSSTSAIRDFDFSNSEGCIWLNTGGDLAFIDSVGNVSQSKTFQFPLHGLKLVRKLPSGLYLTGGAYPSNRFFYTADYLYSSFIATLDSTGNGVIDSTSIVWPLDVNRDYTISYSDIAYLNLAYGAQGPSRDIWPDIRGNPPYFQSDFAVDWVGIFCNGINYKHADINGDGVVDSLDFIPFKSFHGSIVQVYLRKGTESKLLSTPDFSIVPERNIVAPGDTVRFFFVIGNTLNQVDSLCVFAFGVCNTSGNFDPSFVRMEVLDSDFGQLSEFRIDTSGVYPGFLLLRFMLSRLDLQNRNRLFDTLGYVDLKVYDTISVSQTDQLSFESIIALDNCGNERAVIPVSNPILIQTSINSIHEAVLQQFNMFPVPAKNKVNLIFSSQGIKNIRVTDMLGKVILDMQTDLIKTEIKTEGLAEGMYIVSVNEQPVFDNQLLIVTH